MKKLFILFISLILSVILLEILLQTFNIQPKIYKVVTESEKVSDNPLLGYVPNPSYKSHNSLGLNNSEIDKSKKNGIVLGDSVTYGCCRDQYDFNFSSLLNSYVKDNYSPDFEIINAGVNGYNTVQEVEFYLENLKDLNPELIILQVSQNDWNKISFDSENIINEMTSQSDELAFWILNTDLTLKDFRKFHLVQFYLYFQALESANSILAENTFNPRKLLNIPKFGQEICFGGDCDGDISSDDAQIISDGFTSLKSSLNEDQKVLVVLFPDFTDISDYDQQLVLQHDYVSNLAANNEYYYLDLLECYQSLEPSEIELIHYDDDTGHPSIYGHQVAADCISNYIDENDLLSE